MSEKYQAIHNWIKKNKPKPENCEICGKPGKLELSNKTGKLIRDIDNFQWIHCSCHKNYDINNNLFHEGKTSITIDREIRDKLEILKLIPEEHLNSVLRRIIKVYEENKK